MMAEAMFLLNERTGKKFRIIKIDATKKEITLKGDHNAFTDPYDIEKLKKLGYKPVKLEVPDVAPQ
jgi:hypothetical protein